jgi:hypothetical protein
VVPTVSDSGRARRHDPIRALPGIPFGHPALRPFALWRCRDADAVVPDLEVLNGWARESSLRLPGGAPLSFVTPPSALRSALDYERRIAATGEIATRPGNLHDACNALVWLTFPRTKAALNAIHIASGRACTGSGRGRCRDAATLLDESGMLVACADADVLRLWEARRWRDAFRDRRDDAHPPLRAVAIGHGLLAKLVAPFRQITGKALVLTIDAASLPGEGPSLAAALDAAAAVEIAARGAGFVPQCLLPLPVAALPGWDVEELGTRLFDDNAAFRPRVLG